MKDRVKCCYCQAVSDLKDLLNAPNPFDPSETLTGCPVCRQPADFVSTCHFCDQACVGGMKVGDQYYVLCSEHMSQSQGRTG